MIRVMVLHETPTLRKQKPCIKILQGFIQDFIMTLLLKMNIALRSRPRPVAEKHSPKKINQIVPAVPHNISMVFVDMKLCQILSLQKNTIMAE